MTKKTKRTSLISFALAFLVLLFAALPRPARADTKLTDGTYLVDVTLEGGSGRAHVESPATVTVNDGGATATVIWSSPNYDYMIVAGETYHPINTEGNSTFEIPVLAFDEPFPVVGDTTAMSVPHEIDYQLTFDSTSAEPVDGSSEGSGALPIICGIALIVTAGCVVLALKRKNT